MIVPPAPAEVRLSVNVTNFSWPDGGAGQVRGLRAQPVLRQRGQPVRRDLLDLHLPQAEGRDLVDPLQGALHRVAGGPRRRPAHSLQL